GEPNRQQLRQQLERAADHPHFAAGHVTPLDRHLGVAVAEPLGDVKRLDVEHEPVDPLPPEDVAPDLAPEELEAALGVDNARVADQAIADQVEQPRREPPIERLPDPDPADCARADYDV